MKHYFKYGNEGITLINRITWNFVKYNRDRRSQRQTFLGNNYRLTSRYLRRTFGTSNCVIEDCVGRDISLLLLGIFTLAAPSNAIRLATWMYQNNDKDVKDTIFIWKLHNFSVICLLILDVQSTSKESFSLKMMFVWLYNNHETLWVFRRVYANMFKRKLKIIYLSWPIKTKSIDSHQPWQNTFIQTLRKLLYHYDVFTCRLVHSNMQAAVSIFESGRNHILSTNL